MPLVRIDIRRNPDPSYARKLGNVVYEALRTTFGVPERDNFQILNEHDGDHFVYDPSYLGIARTDGLVYIQLTVSEGRSVEQKKALYKAIAEGLNVEAGVRLEDVFINLVEVKPENWSFGNGVAQYVK
ncbi:tautomerase family protein [Massilia sp. METH4]|uniref:tautomerase family protein n=1 Tax=Massilia sp. METH4 TaxID=3123041 RepID=UPI0030CDFA74